MGKEYSNGEVTVTWQPDKCIHSGICVEGLSEVFQPKEKPWIKIHAANTAAIVKQVKQCPTQALGYYFANQKESLEIKDKGTIENIPSIEVRDNGPLIVYGNIKIKYTDGRTEVRNNSTAFCRCGASHTKPFCDGSHKKPDFER